MRTFFFALAALVRGLVLPQTALALENAALRQQLGAYLRTGKRPQLRRSDRVFWVLLRRVWSDWATCLVIVQPATVIGWHRKGYKALWQGKSRGGRPPIPARHIAFIRCISGDHPERGEDRIAEELAAKFGLHHSPSTIRRYMVPRQRPPHGGQTWRTFVRNHARELWACDFLTQYTATFAVAYVFDLDRIARQSQRQSERGLVPAV